VTVVPAPIVLVFALPVEWTPWRLRHPFFRIVNRTPRIYMTGIRRVSVKVAICGVGARQIAPVMTALSGEPVRTIVSVGLAAGLARNLRTGDIVMPRDVSSLDGRRIALTDQRLLSAASRCGVTIVDRIVSGDRILGSAEEKRRVQTTGCALDLESLPIMAAAASQQIPAGAIRVIGDGLDDDLPWDFSPMVTPDGRLGAIAMTRYLASHPHRTTALARFGCVQIRVLNALARVLDGFVAALDARHPFSATQR
jgi:nucleoside phosphorylase